MNLPTCPNHKQSVSLCAQSRLRLVSEGPQAFCFMCNCCKVVWMVTKPKVKEESRWTNQCRRIQQATEREREMARKRAFSFARV